MKKYFSLPFLITYFIILVIIYLSRTTIWENIEKIGALATAIALVAAMYQSLTAWKAVIATTEANAQTFFQQKFNLILEQHNILLSTINPKLTEGDDSLFKDKSTSEIIISLRVHKLLSPYMRILYHTLKTIRTELTLRKK